MAGGDGGSLFGPSRADVTANEGVAEATFLKLPMTLAMAARGPQCFDVDYYMRRNAVSFPLSCTFLPVLCFSYFTPHWYSAATPGSVDVVSLCGLVAQP